MPPDSEQQPAAMAAASPPQPLPAPLLTDESEWRYLSEGKLNIVFTHRHAEAERHRQQPLVSQTRQTAGETEARRWCKSWRAATHLSWSLLRLSS